MIRRTPTRIELKLEDISEFEQLKREAEAKADAEAKVRKASASEKKSLGPLPKRQALSLGSTRIGNRGAGGGPGQRRSC